VIQLPILAVSQTIATDDQVLEALTDSFGLIVPEMVLGLAACVLFLGGTFRANRHLWGAVALVSLIAAGIALLGTRPDLVPEDQIKAYQTCLYASPLLLDPLALLIKGMAIAAGIILVLFSWDEVPDKQAADYHGCLLVIVAGLCLTGTANELVTLFVALELVSIPTYIILYLPKHDSATQEAALKYFLLSVFSSALLLFGFSYLYGLAGTTNIPALMQALVHVGEEDMGIRSASQALPVLAQVALIMVVAGIGFRITAVPFHFYAPDVYQGAPTSGAALLAFIPKVAGFAALLRILGFVLPADVQATGIGLALGTQVPILFWILAAVTMFLGNLLALLQSNLKRMLAYSSVAHAGYMLIGLAMAPYLVAQSGAAPGVVGGVETLLFYLAAYGAMTIGAFAVLAYLSTPQRPVETLDDLAGLSRSHPGVALLMLLFLFSLIGIPLTAGFTGKFMLFFGAMAVGSPEHASLFRILAFLGVLNAAIGAWYYLKIVAYMYLRTSVKPLEKRRAWPGLTALWICALLTVGLGFNPGSDWLMQATRSAAQGAKMPTVTGKGAPNPANGRAE
jgi:NADH-quinone oxidoreductase subunit N